ncbi:hypothetical protein [Pseudomonas alkylphenolica]|uniref:DUF4760 domain-containing protein n=1 Tax=Pseudomonas alkylphenolica TaxID=237609 RepID=A0A077FCU7_9PSED|nr:hypothetical protein [Pseudomonas alkylphenolica]AIL62460.1 hypothetical protein PSAKL28_32980 [Pseudomonas alkylphenolica]
MEQFFGAIWRALATEVGRVVVGFLFTTILGGCLGYFFQWMTWRRQARLDMYRQRYADGALLLEQLSSIVDRRYFRLQRLIWAICDGAPAEKLAIRESEYFETVSEWNENLRSFHNRIRLLIGEKESLRFLDYADDNRGDNPESLHYRFVKAHRLVVAAKNNPKLSVSARLAVNQLNWSVSSFAYDITTLFVHRASSLELLVPASVDTAQSRAIQTGGKPDHK